MKIQETLQTEVRGEFDVIVVGAGSSGIGAAMIMYTMWEEESTRFI